MCMMAMLLESLAVDLSSSTSFFLMSKVRSKLVNACPCGKSE